MLHGSDIAQQRSAMQLQCTVDIRNRFGVAAYPRNGENIIDQLTTDNESSLCEQTKLSFSWCDD